MVPNSKRRYCDSIKRWEKVVVRSKPYFRNVVLQIMLGLWIAGDAEGGVVRSVSQGSGSTVGVTIAWNYVKSSESCLIIEELIPDGWVFGNLKVGELSGMRQVGRRLHIATGVNIALSPQGSLTYSLLPSAAAVRPLQFAGVARTMQDTKRVSMPIGGAQSFVLPSEEATRVQLMLTGIQSFLEMPSRGLRLEFALVPPPGQTLESGAASRATVYVDHTTGLVSAASWRCIFTSIPEARVNSPSAIDLPMGHRSGFYKLRAE